MNKVKWMMLSFYGAAKVEGVHPMDSGIFRRKYRRDRRAGMPREHPVVFYTRYGWEILSKHLRYVWLFLMFHRAYRHVVDGVKQTANDLAMQPVQAHELDTLELFTATSAAKVVVEKMKQKTSKFPSTAPTP